MGFAEAVSSALGKYATFSGRASRSEYWWFYLFTALLVVAAIAVDWLITGGLQDAEDIPFVTLVVGLGLFLPSLAVTIRRLHDSNRSGWWYLIGLVPVVGGIILLIFMVIRGTEGDNRFGPDPLAGLR